MPCSSLVNHFPSEGWPALRCEFDQPYMTRGLCPFLAAEWEAGRAHPGTEDVFNAFGRTSFDDIKVVIVGRDPYPNPLHATGLAFSAPATLRRLPLSLRWIYRELEDDPEIEFAAPVEGSGDLGCWADQGVLLLNSALTHGAKSHPKWWRTFTDKTIELVNQRHQPVAFLFWGREAWRKAPLIRAARHFARCAAHPDPRGGGFVGCRHFSQTNTFLAGQGLTPIDWSCVRS